MMINGNGMMMGGNMGVGNGVGSAAPGIVFPQQPANQIPVQWQPVQQPQQHGGMTMNGGGIGGGTEQTRHVTRVVKDGSSFGGTPYSIPAIRVVGELMPEVPRGLVHLSPKYPEACLRTRARW